MENEDHESTSLMSGVSGESRCTVLVCDQHLAYYYVANEGGSWSISDTLYVCFNWGPMINLQRNIFVIIGRLQSDNHAQRSRELKTVCHMYCIFTCLGLLCRGSCSPDCQPHQNGGKDEGETDLKGRSGPSRQWAQPVQTCDFCEVRGLFGKISPGESVLEGTASGANA